MIRVPQITAPSAGDTSFPEPVIITGGIPVYLLPGGTSGLLRIEFLFPAGEVTERVHLSASATAAMLTEGTHSHDANSINDMIDRTGAMINSSSGKETTGTVVVTLTRMLDEVLALTHELLYTPSFPGKEFSMLTEKRIQAFLTGRKRTAVIARELFWEALCGGMNPYGRITREEDYHALTTDDLREYHYHSYRPEKIYITIAGKDPDRALPLVERYFSSSLPWQKPSPLPLPFAAAEPGRLFREVAGSVQSTVRIGWRGITRDHPDFHALVVAVTILGGYFGSRLMRKIREEKGFTYGIHAVAGAFSQIGYITIMTDVANGYRDETISEIWKEIERLRNEEVQPDEMRLVINQMLGDMARMFDGPFSQAETIKGVAAHEVDAGFFSRFVETLTDITPARVREIFNTYFIRDQAYEIIAGAR